MTNERTLKTSEIPSFELMVQRNLAVYALATQDEECYQRGYYWYDNEHKNCVESLQKLHEGGIPQTVDIFKFCQVVSIISPGRKWGVNIKDAYATILAWYSSDVEEERVEVLSTFKVSRRYGLPCFRRAWGLLDGKYSLEYKKSPKTFSFAHNLTYPTSSPEITFDQHDCHISLGEWDDYGSIGISYAQYKKLAPVIQHCADLLGIDARRFQSIVWTWRVENLGVEVELA